MAAPADRIFGVEVGRWLIFGGLLLVALGAVLLWAPRLFSWFGHLPGDIRIERDGVYIFIPITSALVLSAGLSLLWNLVAWILSRGFSPR